MAYDISSWGVGSSASESIPKIIENFRILWQSLGQINSALASGVTFKGVVTSHSAIATSFPSPQSGWAVIVQTDETHANMQTVYVYINSAWTYVSPFETQVVANINDLPNNSITAAKLSNTAITDKLGYTPANSVHTHPPNITAVFCVAYPIVGDESIRFRAPDGSYKCTGISLLSNKAPSENVTVELYKNSVVFHSEHLGTTSEYKVVSYSPPAADVFGGDIFYIKIGNPSNLTQVTLQATLVSV